MSNKDRPGRSIAFYSDKSTIEHLNELAKVEHRSVSNMLTVLINKEWERLEQHRTDFADMVARLRAAGDE